MNIPDNLTRFEQHDAEQEKQLQKLPKCICCENTIQQEDAVLTPFGFLCDVCLEDLRTEIVAAW